MGDGDIWAADEERKARAAGWVPLADALDALRDHDGFVNWTRTKGPQGYREACARYLAERFAPAAAPEGADERNGHGMGDVTPDQIATFDQALADVENNLDVLIDLWRTGDPDSPEHIRIAGLCVALGDSEWDRIAFVEILVAAIRRLDRKGGNHG